MAKDDRLSRALRTLDEAATSPDGTARETALRAALRDRSNVVVAKAATLAARGSHERLRDELLAAFQRLADEPERDPTCRAKEAIVQTLTAFGERDPAPFLRGLRHVQMEPVWGGRVDTAGTLRARCALALVATDIDPDALLVHLTDALGDREKTVRIEAIVAIAQIGAAASALLVRLKTLCGDAEPDVTGQCFAALLELAPADGVAFVARYLHDADEDVRFEAVNALAQTKIAAALEYVIASWPHDLTPDVRRAAIASLAGSPHRRAMDFLLERIDDEDDAVAAAAVSSIAQSRFRAEMRAAVQAAVTENGGRAVNDRFAADYAEHERRDSR